VTHLLGLYREVEYSPGRHRSNDALLLEQVGQALRANGLSIELTTIDRAAAAREPALLVFSMCQGRAALDALAGWEAEGTRIVNSPRASFNTYRDHLPSLMRRAGVPFPPTMLISTLSPVQPEAGDVNGGVWLKRGDVHASVAADVQRIDSVERLRAAVAEFARRGIVQAALQTHQRGEEIKFYGVAGGAFFYWFYPDGRPDAMRTDFRTDDLQQLAEDAAAAAGLEVFGGDVIVSPDGDLTLIDLNDWPSFAPCRDAAAQAIATYLMRRVDASWNRGLVPSENQSAV
jgi:glutathione synthase/RimK-type ligase-like ATP-grasp enzyme